MWRKWRTWHSPIADFGMGWIDVSLKRHKAWDKSIGRHTVSRKSPPGIGVPPAPIPPPALPCLAPQASLHPLPPRGLALQLPIALLVSKENLTKLGARGFNQLLGWHINHGCPVEGFNECNGHRSILLAGRSPITQLGISG